MRKKANGKKRVKEKERFSALWQAVTPDKCFIISLTNRPLKSGFLNIPQKYASLFPTGIVSQQIICVLENIDNPVELTYSPKYIRIAGGLTEWFRNRNAQAGDLVRVEVLIPHRKYRISIVKKGQELIRFREIFETLGLHPKIAEVSGKLYADGHYAQAIREAFVAMNNIIKEHSGKHDLDGTTLMEAAFAPSNPVLKINEGNTQNDKDEKEGSQKIYTGSMLAIRNPLSHEPTKINDAYVALEYLSFASLFTKIALKCPKARKPRSKGKIKVP
jgi:uncharacterized protein (TIGR02391 family)